MGCPILPPIYFRIFPKAFEHSLATISERALAIKPEVLEKSNAVDGVAYIDVNYLASGSIPNLDDISGNILYGKNQLSVLYEADPRYQYHDDGRDINGSYGDTEEGGLTYFSADGKKLKYPLIVYVTQTQDGQAAKLAKLWLVGG